MASTTCRIAIAAAAAAAWGAGVAAEPAEQAPAVRWLTPSLTYDGAAVVNLRGGARTGSTYVGNLHLKLSANGEARSLPGTSAFADVLTIHGGRPSLLAGDAQGVSNIEGQRGTQIEELWVQHNFEASSVSLLAGIYDLNSEFYRLQAAGLFLNSSFGIGAEFAGSGVEGPSIFPRTSAGVRVAFKPADGVLVRAAVLDGVPVARPDGSRRLFEGGDGVLVIGEVALLSRPAATATAGQGSGRDRIGRFSSLAAYDDKLAFGAWRYSARYADLSDTDANGQALSRRGSAGFYALAERLLWSSEGSNRRVSAFAQAGGADARTNRFGSRFGAGIGGSGWHLMNEGDQFGASVTRAANGAHYARSQAAQNSATDRSETTFELTFLTQVSKHLAVQPDLQYVVRPGTNPSTPNAWVVQLRFEISF